MSVPLSIRLLAVALSCLATAKVLAGQTYLPGPELPDAPGFGRTNGDVSSSGNDGIEPATATRVPRFRPAPLAPLYHKYIEPEQAARPLIGAQKKLIFSLHQIASPYMFVSMISAAGYEHAVNGSPNFGTDRGAFGQRLGAAAIRDTSQAVFSDAVMPTLLHQDPRYYVMGKRHNAFARGGYAVSRVFIGRSDAGNSQPNYALFAGHGATAILQNAYYPSQNQGVTETAKGFAGSFAGVALSNSIREFLPDLLHFAHLE